MSITVKQLNALSREFDFNASEARRFLGKEEPKKRGRPAKKVVDDTGGGFLAEDGLMTFLAKTCSGGACKNTPAKPKAKKPETKKPEKKTSTGRRPSGYNLFVKSQGVGIVVAAKQWKALSESKREAWNTKAKRM